MEALCSDQGVLDLCEEALAIGIDLTYHFWFCSPSRLCVCGLPARQCVCFRSGAPANDHTKSETQRRLHEDRRARQ